MVANVDKTNQIPHTDVISPTFEGDDVDDVWWVQSQHHLGAIYKIHAPFTEYASCTCEWALWGNFCKHQIVVLLACTNLTTKNIIEYCGTYYGTHHVGLKCMFVDSTYLQLDDATFNDEDCNQDPVNEVNIVDIGGLTAMDEDSCFENVNVPKGSSTPMDWVLAHLHETVANITIECTTGASVRLCDHATSFIWGVGSNIPLFDLSQQMHAPMNGISSDGWWVQEFHKLDEGLTRNNDGTFGSP